MSGESVARLIPSCASSDLNQAEGVVTEGIRPRDTNMPISQAVMGETSKFSLRS